MPASDDLEVLEGTEVCKAGMVGLDVDEPGHLAQRLKVLQLGRIHGGMARTEGEVGVDLLEPVEGGVEDGEAALYHRAVAEGLDVAGVDNITLFTQ